jgi:hypothetical protein
VAIIAFKLSDDGNTDHYTLRLQEIKGIATKFDLHSALAISAVAETAMTEDVIVHPGLSENGIEIGAHETMTLQLTIPHGKNEMNVSAR